MNIAFIARTGFEKFFEKKSHPKAVNGAAGIEKNIEPVEDDNQKKCSP